MKLTSKMREALERAASRDENQCEAYAEAVSMGHVVAWAASKVTLNALFRRGLITYRYGTQANPVPWPYRTAVLTVAGWALVRPGGRPAERSRLTLDAALEEAHAAT